MFINSKFLAQNRALICLSAIWAFILLTPLMPFPTPSVLIGHPWKAELAASFIGGVFLCFYLFGRRKVEEIAPVSSTFFIYIIAPCLAFIFWSASSGFFANSGFSVAHHTLVWSVYLIFLVFFQRLVSEKRLLGISLWSLISVVGIVSFCCVFEFLSEDTIGETFGYRYGRYAEIFAVVLPLVFSFVLRLNRKHLWLAISATVILWLGLLFAMSRGALFSSIIGLSIFILLRIFSGKSATEKKRLIGAAVGLFIIALLTQFSLSFNGSEQKGGTFSRISTSADKDPDNSLSRNVRFLFAEVGREMFFDNYLKGVGADNFGLEFNKYRAVISENPANAAIARQQEEYLPERAHNEYLQILAELGIVGGIIILWLLYGIAKLGFAEIIASRFKRSNILTHSTIGGIAAFLINSAFSSYSFRLTQNGLVFFFLLAILLRNCAFRNEANEQKEFRVEPRLSFTFAVVALIVCISLTTVSGLKAASQYCVYQAERQENFDAAKSFYESAKRLDTANAAANFSFGRRLLAEGDYSESAKQLEQAVRKGTNNSISYSYLISAQTLANEPSQAQETARRAVEIFPYSVFLRVRYAALLDQYHESAEAESQLKIAARLDKKQAKTWWRLINDGSLRASQESYADQEAASLQELTPNQAIYAVLAEREITHPEEKKKFGF